MAPKDTHFELILGRASGEIFLFPVFALIPSTLRSPSESLGITLDDSLACKRNFYASQLVCKSAGTITMLSYDCSPYFCFAFEDSPAHFISLRLTFTMR